MASNCKVAPVLKSNAYGHGLVEAATVLQNQEIPFFVVDSYFEAVALRAKGITIPILVIGYSRPEIIASSRLKRVVFTVTSLDTLRMIAKYPKVRSSVHIKIDTGMHRQGILPEDVDEASSILKQNPQIHLEGVCSHFSDADNLDGSFTAIQIREWNYIADKLKSVFPNIKYFHVSNTDGSRLANSIKANIVRVGIGLYGLVSGNQFSPKLNILPVMKMRTIITDVKHLKKDETVGYGNTFIAKNDMLIATIPVGYFEGLDRRLSNTGKVLVGREKIPCPIIGRISMNITIIDVSGLPDTKIGDEVTVIDDNTNSPNSIISIAQQCNTIPYEIAVKIPAHLKRVVC